MRLPDVKIIFLDSRKFRIGLEKKVKNIIKVIILKINVELTSKFNLALLASTL